MQESVSGFTIPTPIRKFDPSTPDTFGKSLCPTQYEDPNNIEDFVVGFDVDVSTGCVVPLNISELIQMCCEGANSCPGAYDSRYALSSGVPVFLQATTGYALLITVL